MNIDDLLNKYLEGETTTAEEEKLRGFFRSGQAPGRLAAYRPLFAYFDEEIRKVQSVEEIPAAPRRRPVYWAAAASILFAAGIGLAYLGLRPDPCLCSANYVIINGRCYTDVEKARMIALETLQEVATPAGDFFPGNGFFSNNE